jgi:hypothetical protein
VSEEFKLTKTNQWIQEFYKRLDDTKQKFRLDETVFTGSCTHPGMKLPLFDSKAAKNMTASEVRKFFPRGNYNCPVCKQSVINYASFQHYIAGDW